MSIKRVMSRNHKKTSYGQKMILEKRKSVKEQPKANKKNDFHQRKGLNFIPLAQRGISRSLTTSGKGESCTRPEASSKSGSDTSPPNTLKGWRQFQGRESGMGVRRGKSRGEFCTNSKNL